MASLKFALRSLRATPFITAVAVLSLALGIGANAAIFSLFEEVLMRPLPVPEAGRLVNFVVPGPNPGSQSCGDAGGCDEVLSYPMFRDLQESQIEAGRPSLTGIAAHVTFGANLAYQNQTVNGRGVLVSGSYFSTLQLQPRMGRLIGPSDDQVPGNHPVAVLAHEYWENRLGSDPSVVDQTIVVNGTPMTILGVAPEGFKGTTLSSPVDVFVPLTMGTEMGLGDFFENRRRYFLYLFGRLQPGATLESAQADLNQTYRNIINEVEAPLQEGLSDQTMAQFRAKEIVLEEGRKGQSSIDEEASTPLNLLLSITVFVLIIACANIANLLLARGARREQEVAIRMSIGSGRLRVFGQFLAEAVLLSLIGGVLSLAVAVLTLNGIATILPAEVNQILSLGLSPSVLLFTGILAIGTGLLFGLYPALQSTRPDLVTALKANTGQSGGSRAAVRFRTALVTAQIALSMTLLIAAGLFIKSLLNVSRIDLGVETEQMLTFAISPSQNGYSGEESRILFEEVTRELEALPGVTGVTSSLVPLLGGSSWGNDVSVQGYERGPDIDSNSRFNEVGASYFSTVGMSMLAGREFTESDAGDSTTVAVVNEAFARKFGLNGAEAVGARMARGGTDDLNLEIVGVVEDAKYSDVKDEVPPIFFLPMRQNPNRGRANFYIRTATEPTSLVRQVNDVIRNLDPNLPVEGLKTMEAQINENTVIDRMVSILSAAFAVLATLLAGIGLYGVLSYTVLQRTREIGLRMALGAGRSAVRGMVLRQVLRMTVVGGVLGLLAGLFLGRAAQSLLFGLEEHDPFVIVLVSGVLGAVAVAAGYLPALRASQVDPMVALRYE